MHLTKLQAVSFVIVVACVLACALPSAKTDDKDHKKSPANGDGVEKLLKERIGVLEQIAKLRHAAYLQREVDFEAMLQSQLDVLNARLELAKKPAERVAIREEILKQARRLEEAAKKLFEAQAGDAADMLRAKAFRLRAEADLLRERQRSAGRHHEHEGGTQ